MWNYIDLLPLFIICTVCIFEASNNGSSEFYNSTFVICVFSLSSFMVWIKLVYFLRLFKSFAYLIRMISRVIVDMGPFLVIMLISIVAFAESFFIVSNMISSHPHASEDEEGFAGDAIFSIFYVYLMSLGEFDFEYDYEPLIKYYLYFLFFLCTMFNLVIMLNLLIAIISESFAAVNST